MERINSPATQGREQFLEYIIKPRDASSEIVAAFRDVDRAEFAPESEKHLAYTDRVIRIDDDSTISQPSLVVEMVKLLEVQPDDVVLEIGTATGYQASVLSRLAKEIHTVERKPEISAIAAQNITRLGYANVHTYTGDGAQGVAGKQFNKIIVTAAIQSIPNTLEDQLQEGGILIAPVGPAPKNCILTKYVKINGTLQAQEHGECSFVPLYSNETGGWDREAVDQLRKQSIQDYRPNTGKFLQRLSTGTSYTYTQVIASLQTTMSEALVRKQPLTEANVLDLMSIINASIMHSTADFDERALITRMGTDMAMVLDRKRKLSAATTVSLHTCGVTMILELQKD